MKRWNRRISMLLAIAMLWTNTLIYAPQPVHADKNGRMIIEEIYFTEKHEDPQNPFNVTGGEISFLGHNLDASRMLYAKKTTTGFFPFPQNPENQDNDFFLKIILSAEEARDFKGEILVHGDGVNRKFQFRTENIPYIKSSDKKYVDYSDAGAGGELTLDISNNTLPRPTLKFGYGSSGTNDTPIPYQGQPSLTFRPKPSPQYGSHSISITESVSDQEGLAPGEKVKLFTEYKYDKIFVLTEELDLRVLTLYPNVATKGSYINLESDKIRDSIEYRVYFLDNGPNGEVLSDHKMYTVKRDDFFKENGKQKMRVMVPDNEEFKTGEKKVVVTRVVNGEIVARSKEELLLNVIDGKFAPVINEIKPDTGSDEGSDAQIIGKNILIPDIPSLIGEVPEPSFVNPGIEQVLTYDVGNANLTFNGKRVTALTRKISATVGRQATIKGFDVQGLDDFIDIRIDSIGNVAPITVDVLVETVTTIRTADGKSYEFNQSATKKNAYTFINSSQTPKIEAVHPKEIQVIPNGLKYNPKEETLISIEGDGFFVNKFSDDNATVRINYPRIFIQNGEKVGEQPYIAKFDKSGAPSGKAFVKVLKNGRESFLLKDPNQGETEENKVLVGMEILNDKDEPVSGSKDNEIGKRIVLYIPKQLEVVKLGGKYIQIINPKRNSDAYGTHGISTKEVIFFQTAKNEPVISSVVPNIVPITGKQKVLVTGANFDEGVKVYIDGKLVEGVKRSSNEAGNEMVLTFEAPPGREGTTQIQVVNPDGGTDVKEFHYIKSLGQDPKLLSISPDKGSANTLVIANGDNFVRPNPTAKGTVGLDAYKLIGSRIFVDGRDVNEYKTNSDGGILFAPYSSPAKEVVLKAEKNKAELSKLHENAVLEDATFGRFYNFTKDDKGNPALFDGAEIKFRFEAEGADLYAIDVEGNKIKPVTVSENKIVIGSGASKTEIHVSMDTNILRLSKDKNGSIRADLADYAEAITLKETNNDIFYTLRKEINQEIVLSSGGTKYTIFSELIDKNGGQTYDNAELKARDKNGNTYKITVTADGFRFKDLAFQMLNPYVEKDGVIVGQKVKIISKKMLQFVVPTLYSGTGFKEVKVVNPDTKSDKLEKGFYYYHQPATHPIISSIIPNRGAVSGGYLVTLTGHDFFESTSVFFDGIPVSKEGKSVSIDGKSMQVRVPAYPIDISTVFGVGEITVPVSVVNTDGASYSVEKGFTYVKPASAPKIKEIKLDNGSSTGGELVVITGEDFRFFEPYINMPGGTYEYEPGRDLYTDLNAHLSTNPPKWDDLLAKARKYKELVNGVEHEVDLWEGKQFEGGKSYYGYTEYFDSKILPIVFFGNQKAKIVEFETNYLKVLTPPGKGTAVDVRLINNDSGLSNSVTYTYSSTNPTIDYINPSSGARVGSEIRELIGSNFYKWPMKIYKNSDAAVIGEIVEADRVDTLLRFGELTNQTIPIGSENDGRINANHAVVRIEGGLRVSFDGKKKQLHVSIEEGGRLYQRVYGNFEGDEVFIPANQLKDDAGNYYKPSGFDYDNDKVYNEKNYYELIGVKVDKIDKRLIVSRGYSPENRLDTTGKIVLKTPSYYTIGTVKVHFYNTDGGTAETDYTYLNPASKPLIISAKPMDIIPKKSTENDTDEDQRMVQASTKGGARVEIEVMDLRDDPKLFFGTKAVNIIEIVNNKDTQTIIAEVPAGTDAEIGEKKPIIVENKDGGIAISTDKSKLGKDKRLLFFIYRKPLSDPAIKEIVPEKTSQYGGHTIEVRGQDIRKNASIILGSKGGIPVSPTEVDPFGRFLKFVMPAGIRPGPIDVQIQNADFGLVTLKDGLKIISYPELDSEVRDGKNVAEVTVLSTEGGQVITLRGKNFMDGAKVYFGGDRKELGFQDKNGVKGFFRDDKYYLLTQAVEAGKVEFVDSHTLKVHTPKMDNEKIHSITVINPDEGMSDGELQIKYSLPKPSATHSLKASIVNDKYIKLYDYVSDNVKYYTIFAYFGNKKESELKKNNYTDFKALATTSREPYKLDFLEGFDRTESKHYLHFVVKGVNDFGSSSWSNIATLKYQEFKQLEFPSPKKPNVPKDGSRPAFEKYGKLTLQGKKGELLFDKAIAERTSLKFGYEETANGKHLDLLFAKNVILNSKDLAIETPLFYTTLNPNVFGASVFNRYLVGTSAYGNLEIKWEEDFNTSAAESKLSATNRQLKTVSPVLTVNAKARTAQGGKEIPKLDQSFKFAMKLDAPEIVYDKSKALYLYKYDIKQGTWRQVNVERLAGANLLRFTADGPAYYVLCQF